MKKITLLLSFIACVAFTQAQTVLFSENFNNVTTTATADANGNIAGSKDFATKLDSVIGTAGWEGSKVYESNNRLKIGTSSTMGYLTTPSIDLSGSSFIVTVDLASWNNTGGNPDTGSSIDVQVDGVVVETISYTTQMNTYSTKAISPKTATSKIKFAAKVGKNRFYIDNVSVTSTTGFNSIGIEKFRATVVGNDLQIKNVANGATVEIFSALGSKVQTSVLENGKVSVDNLSKGMYIVRVGKNTQKFML
jgi:hypothetical protein